MPPFWNSRKLRTNLQSCMAKSEEKKLILIFTTGFEPSVFQGLKHLPSRLCFISCLNLSINRINGFHHTNKQSQWKWKVVKWINFSIARYTTIPNGNDYFIPLTSFSVSNKFENSLNLLYLFYFITISNTF